MKQTLEDYLQKKRKVAVIGLGYVGLPLALAFAKHYSVIGFDINAKRVDLMKQGIDPSDELVAADFDGADISFTSDIEHLKDASFFIVAVPTPIDQHTMPDLVPLMSASKTVGKAIKAGDVVVFESTVYPGCTEEDCVPVIEAVSGLKYRSDFKVGYSPERINPGDKEHTITKILKVVSGCDDETADLVSAVYAEVIEAGVFKAASISVAEAAKVIENTQRDLNIALMNELSIIFEKMNINTYDVLKAAGTKWNFLNFSPGLVGGHCIGVDPYYLTYKSKALGHEPRVILSGRAINDGMGQHIARKTVQKLIRMGKNLSKCRVLVMGTTFKENVSDIRNSKVVDVINELKEYALHIDVIDAYASSDELMHEYGYELKEAPEGKYDAIILAVAHTEYKNLSDDWFKKYAEKPSLLVDVKGVMKDRKIGLEYWSL